MKKNLLLLFAICTSTVTHALESSDFKSDLNTLTPRQKKESKVKVSVPEKKMTFQQKFAENYAGFYELNPSSTCSLGPNVKKIKLDLKNNGNNPALRAILYNDKEQVLDNKFYPLAKAKISDPKIPSADKSSLLWESVQKKGDKEKKKYERISFAKDVVSFDVERWVGGEGFFDKLLESPELEKISKCNFTKVDHIEDSIKPGSRPNEKHDGRQ